MHRMTDETCDLRFWLDCAEGNGKILSDNAPLALAPSWYSARVCAAYRRIVQLDMNEMNEILE